MHETSDILWNVEGPFIQYRLWHHSELPFKAGVDEIFELELDVGVTIQAGLLAEEAKSVQ